MSLDTENSAVPKMPIAALVWLSMVAALVGNILPVFLGALANTFELDAQQLGFLGGVELGGVALASLTAAFWFRRVDLRLAAIFAIGFGIAGNLLTSWVTDYSELLILRFLTGFLGSGVLYALTLGLIGRVSHPERVIAIAIVLQVASLAVGISAVPLLIEKWELPGVTIGLAMVFCTGLLLVGRIPRRLQDRKVLEGSAGSTNLIPVAFLGSLIVFSIGLGSVWAFLERIGSAAGFELANIGIALAVSGLVGGAGALVAAILGTRFGRVLPTATALGLAILACVMLATRGDWYSYVVAAAMFNFGWNLTTPYLMGAIAATDHTGRLMVLIPAAQAGGYAVGPALTGMIIVGGSYATAGWVSMVFFGMCMLITIPLLRKIGDG